MSGTRIKAPADGLMAGAILLVMVLGIGLILWGSARVEQRIDRLSEYELDRSIEVAKARLDRTLDPLQSDLERMARSLADRDSIPISVLLESWAPLLSGRWGYVSMKMATEDGDEISLCRIDSLWVLYETVGSSLNAPPLRYTTRRMDPDLGSWELSLSDSLINPWEQIWFGRALSNAHVNAAWSVSRSPCSPYTRTYAMSLLIRPDQADRPFFVLVMEVDPTMLPRMDLFAKEGSHVLLLDENSALLTPTKAIPLTGGLQEATALMIEQWKRDRMRSYFRLEGDPGHHFAKVMDHPLNGTNWYVAAVVDRDYIAAGFNNERWILRVGGTLLVLLAGLFVWSFMHRRSEHQQLLKQQRRSETQKKRLAKAIGEREVLNREVHHRVKNNLQVVSSLLNLQAMRLEEGAIKDEFVRGKQRIDSMALVHHKLYALQDLRGIDLRKFFSELVASLHNTYRPGNDTISYEVDTGGIKSDPDTAIELGIILAELVSNCFKHAFPYSMGGHIEITVRRVQDDLYRLLVKDNGIGMDRTAPGGANSVHLGLEIVEALAEQLDGSAHLRTAPTGVTFEVLFRMQGSSLSTDPVVGDTEGRK